MLKSPPTTLDFFFQGLQINILFVRLAEVLYLHQEVGQRCEFVIEALISKTG